MRKSNFNDNDVLSPNNTYVFVGTPSDEELQRISKKIRELLVGWNKNIVTSFLKDALTGSREDIQTIAFIRKDKDVNRPEEVSTNELILGVTGMRPTRLTDGAASSLSTVYMLGAEPPIGENKPLDSSRISKNVKFEKGLTWSDTGRPVEYSIFLESLDDSVKLYLPTGDLFFLNMCPGAECLMPKPGSGESKLSFVLAAYPGEELIYRMSIVQESDKF